MFCTQKTGCHRLECKCANLTWNVPLYSLDLAYLFDYKRMCQQQYMCERVCTCLSFLEHACGRKSIHPRGETCSQCAKVSQSADIIVTPNVMRSTFALGKKPHQQIFQTLKNHSAPIPQLVNINHEAISSHL